MSRDPSAWTMRYEDQRSAMEGLKFERLAIDAMNGCGEKHRLLETQMEQYLAGCDTDTGVECKYNSKWRIYGFYMEQWERAKPEDEDAEWFVSGIWLGLNQAERDAGRRGHVELAVGDRTEFYVLDSMLVLKLAPGYRKAKHVYAKTGLLSSHGVRMPVADAEEHAKRKFKLAGGEWLKYERDAGGRWQVVAQWRPAMAQQCAMTSDGLEMGGW